MRKLTLEGATIIALVGLVPTAMASHKAAVIYIEVWAVLLLVLLIRNLKKEKWN